MPITALSKSAPLSPTTDTKTVQSKRPRAASAVDSRHVDVLGPSHNVNYDPNFNTRRKLKNIAEMWFAVRRENAFIELLSSHPIEVINDFHTVKTKDFNPCELLKKKLSESTIDNRVVSAITTFVKDCLTKNYCPSLLDFFTEFQPSQEYVKAILNSSTICSLAKNAKAHIKGQQSCTFEQYLKNEDGKLTKKLQAANTNTKEINRLLDLQEAIKNLKAIFK